MQDFTYVVNGKEYPVHVIHKRIKNIHYRFVDDRFVISCHMLTPKYVVVNGLNKFAVSLIKRSVKVKPIEEDYIYLYGIKVPLKESGSILFSDGEEVVYKNHTDLMKKLNAKFLKNVTNRTNYFANLMHLPKYNVKIRNMKTRYGSNFKAKKEIHYSTILQHYSFEIIDSVVIHELAHDVVQNHSKDFYDVVYKYCPNYKKLRKKLNRGEYK